MMNTILHDIPYYAFWLLSLVAISTLLTLTHPVVHMLADEIIPVHQVLAANVML